MVSYSEFQEVFKATIGPDAIPFDFDSPWVALYLGKKDGVHVLDYPQFAQFSQCSLTSNKYHFIDAFISDVQ